MCAGGGRMLDIEIEMILGQKRLTAIKSLLNDLTFYTEGEVANSVELDNALFININGWCHYPIFQFDENFQIRKCLQRRLEELSLGRNDIDILLWLLTRRMVLMVRAVAPTDLVSKALDSDDFGIDKSRALYRKAKSAETSLVNV